MVRRPLLALLAGAIVAANWLRLEQPQGDVRRAVLLVALATVPVLFPRRWHRAAAAAVVAFVGASIAFFVSLAAVAPGGAHFFGPVGSRFGHGFADFYSFRLPIDPAVHPQMRMVLLAATFAFTMIGGLAVAARRPILSVAIFLVGAGWPATLLAGGDEVLRGIVILVGALALLAGLSEQPGRFAAPAAAAVALGAVALAASPAVAKPGFLDWQHWNPYAHRAKPVSVSFVWNGQYSGIRFPRKVTTVLSIRAPRTIGTYWRATVLDRYAHDRWVEHVWRETPRQSRILEPPAAENEANTVQQVVTVDALADNHLVGASLPVAFNISEPARLIGQNVAEAVGGLSRGQRYVAWSYAPQPTAESLVTSPPSYPRALTRAGRELEVAPGVNALPFAAPGRVSRLDGQLVGKLAPYRALFARARSVVGDTRSPYAAMVALERWFRATGGFTYSLQPPQTPGLPPLVGFVLQTQTGYCQHFAGAMALMARMLGVPARVSAGFVSGHYVNGEWQVTDHDAHTWVEVWFRGYGWLPFDPTPGRGRLAAPYSSASPRFDPNREAKLLSGLVRGGEVFGSTSVTDDRTPHRGRNLHSQADVGVRGLTAGAGKANRHSLAGFLALLAACAVAAVVLLKDARRRLRYLTRDPRKIAAACAHDLADFLVDQRLPVPRGATFRELRVAVDEHLAVDAKSFAAAADAARFGPPARAPEAARRAREELADLKRRLRRQVFLLDRARGAVSLRSLGFS
jgi:transglutaminase-like putative cysteine protease